VLKSNVGNEAERDRPARADLRALAGLLAFAALVRAFAWSRTEVLFNDGPIFLALADALRAGRFADVLAHPQHPLYPALIAALELLSLPAEFAAVGVSIAGGLLAIAAIFWMAWARFGREVAWISAWVVALHPSAVDFSSDVMSDGLYAGLHLAGFALLVDLLERPGLCRAMAFGLSVGLAYWTRPEGLALAGVAGVCGVGRAWMARADRGRLLRSAAVWLAAGALLVVSLRLVEARPGEDLSWSQKKSIEQLARGGPSAEELALDRQARRATRADPRSLPLPESSIRADGSAVDRPQRSLGGLFEALGRVLRTSFSAVRYELLVFVGLSLLAVGSRRLRSRHTFESVLSVSLILHTGLLVLLVWGAGYVSRRHALAAWLPLSVIAAVGWTEVMGKLRGLVEARGRSRAASAGAASGWTGRLSMGVLVAFLILSWGPRDLRARRADRALERVSAEWLKQSQQSVGPVAAQKMRTAYYAGARFVPLPDGADRQLERQIRGRGARWVIIDAAKLADHRGLAEGIGDWLDPVHVERAVGQEILVLEVIAPTAP